MFISYKKMDNLLLMDVEEPFTNRQLIADKDNECEYETNEIGVPKRERIVNTKILSFKINDKNELEHLRKSPIELIFKHLETEKIDNDNYHVVTTCAFWKYNKE